MRNKIIIQEDDCAPDAYEYFNKQLIEITKNTKKEFMQLGVKIEKDDETSFELNGYVIAWSIDDPYWKLYKLI